MSYNPNRVTTKKEVDIFSDYADIYAELNETNEEADYLRYVHDISLNDDDY